MHNLALSDISGFDEIEDEYLPFTAQIETTLELKVHGIAVMEFDCSVEIVEDTSAPDCADIEAFIFDEIGADGHRTTRLEYQRDDPTNKALFNALYEEATSGETWEFLLTKFIEAAREQSIPLSYSLAA